MTIENVYRQLVLNTRAVMLTESTNVEENV